MSAVPKLSVGLAPGRHTVDLAKLAVDLECERVYLYDSAAVYEDVFIWLARLAEQTDALLGAAVLVPNLRHVMTTASAIATLEDLAPGRFVYGLGTSPSSTMRARDRSIAGSGSGTADNSACV